jgi:hypothetical protein
MFSKSMDYKKVEALCEKGMFDVMRGHPNCIAVLVTISPEVASMEYKLKKSAAWVVAAYKLAERILYFRRDKYIPFPTLTLHFYFNTADLNKDTKLGAYLVSLANKNSLVPYSGVKAYVPPIWGNTTRGYVIFKEYFSSLDTRRREGEDRIGARGLTPFLLKI